MKISFFHPCAYTGEIGGTDIYISQLVQELKDEGNEVSIICPDIVEKTEVLNGVKIYRLPQLYPTDYASLENVAIPKALPLFKKTLQNIKPDILHFHTFGKWQQQYLLHAKSLGIITVITPHLASLTCSMTSMIEYKKGFGDGIVDVKKCAECVIGYRFRNPALTKPIGFISKYVVASNLFYKNYFLKHLLVYESIRNTKKMLSLLNSENIYFFVLSNWYKEILIKNGISEKYIYLVNQKNHFVPIKNYNIDGRIKVLFAGRQNEEKGLFLLLDALPKVDNKLIELHICGPIISNVKERVEKKIQALRIRGYQIIQHGLISNIEVKELMQKMQILCCPSVDAEMKPLTILEAQSMGLPVIGANHSGIRDMIEDNITGFLFESGNIESLAVIINKLVLDRDILIKIHKSIVFKMKQSGDSFVDHNYLYKKILDYESV